MVIFLYYNGNALLLYATPGHPKPICSTLCVSQRLINECYELSLAQPKTLCTTQSYCICLTDMESESRENNHSQKEGGKANPYFVSRLHICLKCAACNNM